MSGRNAKTGNTGKNPCKEAWALFEPILERINKITGLWSVVELGLSQNQIQQVKSWISQIPKGVFHNLKTGSRSETEACAQSEILGCLFLIVAADSSRDESRENAVWPAVRAVFTKDSSNKKLLFTQGQPSKLFKDMLEAAAHRFLIRNVFSSEISHKYFDTIKLQYGFTIKGARRNLHEWLVGLGQPLSVQILLGNNTCYPDLSSDSFKEMWDTLRAYRYDRVSRDRAGAILRASPWVRAKWVPELLARARVKLKSRTPVIIPDASTGVVKGVRLHWLAGAKPRLVLELYSEALNTLTSETRSSQICAAVDGRVTGRWTKQPNGAWHGSNLMFCEPDRFLASVNLRPTQLTLSTFEGDVLEECDLTALDLHRDVLVFDGEAGHLLDSDRENLRTGKSYVILADADLSLAGVPYVEWVSIGLRKAYRLNAPWSEDACLMLEDLEFWRPQILKKAYRPNLRVILTFHDSERPSLGDNVALVAEGIPQDTESATLLLGDDRVELEPHSGSWVTSRDVSLTPEFVLGLEKRRIRLRSHSQVQTVPVILGLEPRGAAIYERDSSSGGAGRWRLLSEEQSLNIGAGRTQIRLLGTHHQKDPVLYEGWRSVGAIPHRGARLATLNLHGWGAPLEAVDKNTRRTMASSVERHGCVSYVIHNLFGRENKTPPLIHLRAPVTPSVHHRVWIWSVNRANPTDVSPIDSEEISIQNDSLDWRIRMLPNTHAIGLAFKGAWLGSWWHLKNIGRLLCSKVNVHSFALLRWFRIPVLSSALSYNMQGAVYKAPLDFLRAWLGGQGLPKGLEVKPPDEGIREVVRHFLWCWKDRPYLVDKMLTLFGKASVAHVSKVNPGMVGFAEICPPLLWAWRSKMPVGEAQLLFRYLWQKRLGLEDDADLKALSRQAGVSFETLRSVRAGLEAGDLSSIIACPTVREACENANGRAALSVLIQEEVIRNRKDRKG